MKLYHLADLHFGVDPPGLGREAHQRLVLEKLTTVSERAQKEGVKFVILAGDVFDSNALATSTVLSLLKRLAEAEGINFIFLPGGGGKHGEVSGHDAYTVDSLYRRLEVKAFFAKAPNLHLLTPEQPRLAFGEEVAFYGGFFDYPRTELDPSVRYHVAVLHGPFGERREFGEKDLKGAESLKYHYLALGHYHRFQKLTPKAAYAGAFLQFEFLPYQEGTSGYVEVELLPNEGPLIRYRVFPDAPRFIYEKVLGEEDLRRVEALDFERTFVRVTAYLAPFEAPLLELKKRYEDRLSFAEGARIEPENLAFLEVLERILTEEVPEEIRAEVKELLLYGMHLGRKRSQIERFLRERYGF